MATVDESKITLEVRRVLAAPVAAVRELKRTSGVSRRAPWRDPRSELPVQRGGMQPRVQARCQLRPEACRRVGGRRPRDRVRRLHAPNTPLTIRSISLMPMNGAMMPPRP
jgi:hypothetical protein